MRDGRAEPGGREASLHRISTDRAASPSPWPCRTGGQACRSGVPAVGGVEAFMNNAGYNPPCNPAILPVTVPREFVA